MKSLKKELQIIAYDLSLATADWEEEDVDSMDNACNRIHSLIFELQEIYPQLRKEADNKRYGRA